MPEPTEKDPVKLVEQIQATMTKMTDENKTVIQSLKDSVDAGSKEAKAAVKLAEEHAAKILSHSTVIAELQQKLAEGVKQDKVAPKTLADVILESEAFKAFAKGDTQKFRIEANTITGQSGSPAANDQTLVQADRLNGIIPGAFRALRIADVIPQGQTSANLVEYTQESGFTNGAVEVAEGDSKPQSTLTFTLANAPVRTIAHWIKASTQILEDAPALRSYIDTRMRYGTDLRFDYQLLRGTGTGQAMSGILKSGNYTAFTPTLGEIALDSVNRAIEAVQVADYSPTAIIMHPTDWHAIERLKVGGTAAPNQYLVGDPLGVITRVLWGLPVVLSNNMRLGYFIVANFEIAYQIFNRSETVVEMFEQDDVNVQKNLLTIRSERRGCLATLRPASSYAGLLISGSSH